MCAGLDSSLAFDPQRETGCLELETFRFVPKVSLSTHLCNFGKSVRVREVWKETALKPSG